MPNCKACGAEIIFKKTTRGKTIPLDAEPRRMATLMKDSETVWIGDAYTVHFETCPDADRFRQK